MNKAAFSKIGIIGIVIFLVIIAIIGYYWWSGSKTTSPEEKAPEVPLEEKKETPSSASFGERVELVMPFPLNVRGIFITVSEPLDFAGGDEYPLPKKGNKFIAVLIRYENEYEESLIFDMQRYYAIDPSGNQYDPEIVKLPALSSSKLNPGNSAQGYITYEVPESIPTSNFCIQYELIRRDSRTVDFCGK